ncbi:MAG: nucleoside-diphosphate kinase [Acidobacteria bacterium]|nr:MAG: nucleoside-diphosphate kinase [Acidobacteriota bacterium]
MQRTLAIIKPDAVANKNTGEVITRIEQEGFRVVGMRMVNLSRDDAEGFYAVHRDKPFFGDLTAFMSSGPAVVLCLEAEDAIAKWRNVMGATNPENAAEGTLRKLFATNIERNVVHGSDAPETAAVEIAYYFRGVDLH